MACCGVMCVCGNLVLGWDGMVWGIVRYGKVVGRLEGEGRKEQEEKEKKRKEKIGSDDTIGHIAFGIEFLLVQRDASCKVNIFRLREKS